MEKEKVYEYAEQVRRELHTLVDRQIDDFLLRAESGKTMESDPATAWPMTLPPAWFKGKKPIAVLFPDGEEVPCKTWRQVAAVILQDCNRDETLHERLKEISGKVAGRARTILGKTDRGMNKPIKIDEGIYFESYFDTEYLLKMMSQVLDAVGYDYTGLQLRIRTPQSVQSIEAFPAPEHEDALQNADSEDENEREVFTPVMM